MTLTRDYNKYLTLKQEDIDQYLSVRQRVSLRRYLTAIETGRSKKLKPPYNTYVVVNIDEPYAEVVWRLIEIGERDPEGLKVLLSNLEVELLGYS